MYITSKKRAAAMERATERREREALAPRLLAVCPDLQSLRILVEDRCALAVTKHVRHVLIDRAPAYFVIACADAACDSHGHDITNEVLSALRMRTGSFESDHVCGGNVGAVPCPRAIHVTVAAEYRS